MSFFLIVVTRNKESIFLLNNIYLNTHFSKTQSTIFFTFSISLLYLLFIAYTMELINLLIQII